MQSWSDLAVLKNFFETVYAAFTNVFLLFGFYVSKSFETFLSLRCCACDLQRVPKDVDTAVEFRVGFSALDAGDVDTRAVDYLSLARISPVLDTRLPNYTVNQVCFSTRLALIFAVAVQEHAEDILVSPCYETVFDFELHFFHSHYLVVVPSVL